MQEDQPTYFSDLPLTDSLLDSIDIMGFNEATPVQAQALPLALAGHDMIACAQTGTGKTAAYLLPILNFIEEHGHGKGLTALIISPTRELAQQIDQQITGLSYYTSASSLAVYGGGSGQEFDRERLAFKQGADIVVATPGQAYSPLKYGLCRYPTPKISGAGRGRPYARHGLSRRYYANCEKPAPAKSNPAILGHYAP